MAPCYVRNLDEAGTGDDVIVDEMAVEGNSNKAVEFWKAF